MRLLALLATLMYTFSACACYRFAENARKSGVVVVFLLALLGSRRICSQDAQRTALANTGEFRLYVEDPNGRPLQVSGLLFCSVRVGSRTLSTEADGTVILSHLPFAKYRLQLNHPGFEVRTIDFQIDSPVPRQRAVTMTVAGPSTIVNVVAATPIGTLDLPVAEVPVPVQEMTAHTIEETNSIDLTEALKKRLNGVYVNENQGNPFQPDVNYRGYTASPLVGSTEGLSVYLDGVRQINLSAT